MEPGESAEEFVQGIGLLTEAYPHLAEMLAEQVIGQDFSYADEFDYGLELILDGGSRSGLGSVGQLRSWMRGLGGGVVGEGSTLR